MNDLISRQAVIAIINKYDFSFTEYMEIFVTATGVCRNRNSGGLEGE